MKKVMLLAVALGAAAAAALAAAVAGPEPRAGVASSHREAPLISEDPCADLTDLYAFRSPDRPNTVTILANVIPGEDPAAGPNYYTFSPNARYNLKIDTNGDVTPDVIYRFASRRRRGRSSSATRRSRTRSPAPSGAARRSSPRARRPRTTSGRARRRATGRWRRRASRSCAAAGRVRRPAGRRVLRRHRRHLRPGRDPQGHGQHRRRQGLLRRLRGAHVRAPDADRRPEREEQHDRRLGVGRPPQGDDARRRHPQLGRLGAGQPPGQPARQRGDHPDRAEGPLELPAALEREPVSRYYESPILAAVINKLYNLDVPESRRDDLRPSCSPACRSSTSPGRSSRTYSGSTCRSR